MENISENRRRALGADRPAGSGSLIDRLERVRYGARLLRGAIVDLAIVVSTVLAVALTVDVVITGSGAVPAGVTWLLRALLGLAGRAQAAAEPF